MSGNQPQQGLPLLGSYAKKRLYMLTKTGYWIKVSFNLDVQ